MLLVALVVVVMGCRRTAVVVLSARKISISTVAKMSSEDGDAAECDEETQNNNTSMSTTKL